MPIVVGEFGAERLGEARTAVVLGSLVPLLLAVASSLAGRLMCVRTGACSRTQ